MLSLVQPSLVPVYSGIAVFLEEREEVDKGTGEEKWKGKVMEM